MICYALRDKRSKKYYDDTYEVWLNNLLDATLCRDKDDAINLKSTIFQFEGEDETEIVEIELIVKGVLSHNEK